MRESSGADYVLAASTGVVEVVRAAVSIADLPMSSPAVASAIRILDEQFYLNAITMRMKREKCGDWGWLERPPLSIPMGLADLISHVLDQRLPTPGNDFLGRRRRFRFGDPEDRQDGELDERSSLDDGSCSDFNAMADGPLMLAGAGGERSLHRRHIILSPSKRKALGFDDDGGSSDSDKTELCYRIESSSSTNSSMTTSSRALQASTTLGQHELAGDRQARPRHPWSDEEVFCLRDAVIEHGTKWNELAIAHAQMFPGRNPRDLQNKWCRDPRLNRKMQAAGWTISQIRVGMLGFAAGAQDNIVDST